MIGIVASVLDFHCQLTNTMDTSATLLESDRALMTGFTNDDLDVRRRPEHGCIELFGVT